MPSPTTAPTPRAHRPQKPIFRPRTVSLMERTLPGDAGVTRDVVIFPFTKVAFKIGRPSSVAALEKAMNGGRQIFLATQHDASVDELHLVLG